MIESLDARGLDRVVELVSKLAVVLASIQHVDLCSTPLPLLGPAPFPPLPSSRLFIASGLFRNDSMLYPLQLVASMSFGTSA